MYKLSTILPFLLLSNFINGQTGFFADGSRWVYHTWESSEPGQQFVSEYDEQDIIHGDTIIGGLNYFKLYRTFHGTRTVYTFPGVIVFQSYDSTGPTFLRYDTILSRVYHLPHIDSSETLIYDFNLQVGDTTPMQSSTFYTTVVKFIDTVFIFSVPLKRLFVGEAEVDFYDQMNFIIEGIGGSNGLTSFQPVWGTLSGGIFTTMFNCFQYMDSIYSPYNSECPFIDFISAIDPVSDDHKVSIGPNPTRDVFNITISEELLSSTFTIVDVLGRVIQSFKLTDIHSTSQLSLPGIYFWRVEHSGRLIRSGKLICE